MSLRWKLTLVVVITTAAALFTSAVIVGLHDIEAYRRQRIADTTAEAEILAASVSSPLMVEDKEWTGELLASISANKNISAAAVFDTNNKIMAHYVRPSEASGASVAPTPQSPGFRIEGKTLEVSVAVAGNEKLLGTVLIRTDIETAAHRSFRFGLVLLLAGVCGVAIVLPASIHLLGAITNPFDDLRAKNDIIEATLGSVDHGVLVIDRNLKVTLANQMVMESFSTFGRDALIGRRIDDLIKQRLENAQAPPEVMERELKMLRSREKLRGEFQLASGQTMEYRQAPLATGGIVRTYTDVTGERAIQDSLMKAREKAENAARAKSQFLAAMSHEIRTPMNGVIGIVELLQSTSLNAEQKQLVDIIRQSGTGLLDVINDILDYSKIEAGHMTVENIPFALAEVIETTALTVGSHSKSKTLNVICTVDPAIDYSVKGDPVRIRQIILNLLGNAMKFTEHGAVGIEAKLKSVSDTKIEVLFEVTDTGIGIDEEQQRKLFKAFSQADYSTTRKYGGTGLGLSISQNLVRLMKGEIGVRSTVGKGSTFWFSVPFDRVSPAERAGPFADYAHLLSGLRVAVCDRVPGSKALYAYLSAIGATALTAEDASGLVYQLQTSAEAEKPVDVVILQLQPGEDGLADFVRAVEAHEALENTKYLFVIPQTSVVGTKLPPVKGKLIVVPAPVQRKQLYESIATLTGRKSASLSDAPDSQPQEYQAPALADAAAARCVLLVAEDNATNQFVIKNQLRRLGYAAEFVGDGAEALAAYHQNKNKYGLLITDCHMPNMDGYDLARTIRGEEAPGVHLPIIALTANALEGERDACLAAGMDDYLFKPTNLRTLDAMVQKYLPHAVTLRREKCETVSTADPVSLSAHTPQAVQAPSADAAIDLEGLHELLGSEDPTYIAEMLAVFLETMRDSPTTLERLIQDGDMTELSRAAHAAKGAALSACALTYGRLCAELETSARRNDVATVQQIKPQIGPAFASLRDFVRSYSLQNAKAA
jgi:signal transduction histidine kinase/CheY-like chemotaxis protein/HPt (histidine-containing phosphotransfer) domain-containing protein